MLAPLSRLLILAAAAVAGAVGTSFVTREPLHAAGESCSAFIGGVDSQKGATPELVLSNLTGAALSLDLKLTTKEGTLLIDRPDEIAVGPAATVAVSLLEQIRRDLPRTTKPYAGLLTVEIRGDAPFASDTVLVHVTQYYGSRKSPKAAFVLRPTFRTNDAP